MTMRGDYDFYNFQYAPGSRVLGNVQHLSPFPNLSENSVIRPSHLLNSEALPVIRQPSAPSGPRTLTPPSDSLPFI